MVSCASQVFYRIASGSSPPVDYDLEEPGDPLDLAVNKRVDFAPELYSSATQDMVWSAETKGPKPENLAVPVDETGKLFVRQLRRAGKLVRQIDQPTDVETP